MTLNGMNPEDQEPKTPERGADRRQSGDRRKVFIDPADLPFPDRRKGGDRRQMDRRVISEEESQEIIKRIVPAETPTPKKSK